MKSPFKFLDAFTLKDSESFFGRTREIEALYKMVFETPLCLIYGLSGTGKTSLVQCGLASQFDGPDWFPFFIRRNEDINESLRVQLDQAIGESGPMDLNEKISYLSRRYLRPVYLVFDQLEELFILGNESEQDQFIADIHNLLKATLGCKIILIIREEYLGQLYNFEKVIPSIFDFRLRVEPMTVKTTGEVLNASFEKFQIRLNPPGDTLIEQIIKNIGEERSVIQLPYLQVYLDRLYREDYNRTYPNGSQEKYPPLEFTKAEIRDFGKIDNVLEDFLEEQRSLLEGEITKTFKLKKDNAKKTLVNLLDKFVTEEGTKRPISFTRESGTIVVNPQFDKLFVGVNPAILGYTIEALERLRILRFTNDTTFELAHDSLAQLIDQKRTDEQRQRNKVLRSLLIFAEADRLLSQKQLNQYEPYLSGLELGQELEELIRRSEENIEKEKEAATAAAAEKERIKQERKRAEMRRKLLWVIGAFAIIAAAFGFIAGVQNQRAQRSERQAQESRKEAEVKTAESKYFNYRNFVGEALNEQAKGNYGEVDAYIERALQFFEEEIQKDEVTSKYIEIDTIQPPVDSLKTWQQRWKKIKQLTDEAAVLYEEGRANNVKQVGDLKLLEALARYQSALALAPGDQYLQTEVKRTEDLIDQKFSVWLERADQLIAFRQCNQAQNALFYLKRLNRNNVEIRKISSIRKMIEELKQKGNCY